MTLAVQAPRRRTGEILRDNGIITQAQLDIALQEQRARQSAGVPLPIAEIIVRNRFCTRDQAEAAVAETTSGQVTGLFNTLLPQSICRRYGVLADRVENNTLLIKAAAPLSEGQKQALVRACLVPVTDVRVKAITKQRLQRETASLYFDTHNLADCLDSLRRNEPTGQLIQSAIGALLKEGLDVGASDIHLDFKGDVDSWISWRVDGTLQRKHVLPKRVMGPLMTRLKTESGMDASETRREQDGRIHYQYGNRIMDFRVSVMPIIGGEGMTLRVLDADSQPSLDAMFPVQKPLVGIIRNLLKIREKRGGLILVSGQTGSGKSTTLNAMARVLPRERSNLVTVEDPVELELPFSRQFQPNALLQQNMAQTERTLLRQDPDVILIGEVRDADSARTALKLIESGHLVLTTIHAESPVQALLRLVSTVASVESREWASFVISQFLKISINQSLRARPCSACSTKTEEGIRVNTEGCHRCNNGRKGRVLVHDTFVVEGDDISRYRLQQALLAGDLAAMQEVQTLPGMQRISRKEVVQHLINHQLLALDDAE